MTRSGPDLGPIWDPPGEAKCVQNVELSSNFGFPAPTARWRFRGPFGPGWEGPGGLLEASWGGPGALLGGPGGVLGRPGASWSPPGAVLGPSWEVPGASWGVPGASNNS